LSHWQVEELAVAVEGNAVALALPHGTTEGPATPLYHRGTDEHLVRVLAFIPCKVT